MQHLAKYIDHTLLKQDATYAQVETLCQEAKQYDFMSVCIQPHFVSYAKQKYLKPRRRFQKGQMKLTW